MSIKRWTEDELSYLEKHAGSKSAKVLAAMMNRSQYSVEAMIKKLRAVRSGKIQASIDREDSYSKEEKELIRKHWPRASREEIEALFPDRTYHSIQAKAHRMGVKRDDDVRLAQRREMSMKGLESRSARISAHLPPAKFYGEKIGNARVFRADQRPKHLDKRPDALPRQKNYVSGSTLSEAI